MSGNDSKVLVDLNAPTFQDDLFDLDVPDLKKVIKTLKKIRKMVWQDVFVDKGLHWEEIISMTKKYSIRLSSSYRAVVTREGAWCVSLRFIQIMTALMGRSSLCYRRVD